MSSKEHITARVPPSSNREKVSSRVRLRPKLAVFADELASSATHILHALIFRKSVSSFLTTSLIALFGVTSPSYAAEFRITSFGLSPTNTFLIGCPADTNSYYILRRGSNVADINTAAALILGGASDETLMVPLTSQTALFRLQSVPLVAPLDTDGDGMDDVFELRHSACLSPLDPGDAVLDSDGDSLTNATEYAVGANPCVSNTPPSVTLHTSTATTAAPGSFLLETTVADADGQILRVDFYSGTNFIGSTTNSPFSFTWTNVAAGDYSVTARAVDNHTLSATSAPINLTVTSGPLAILTGYSALGGCLFKVTATVLIGTGSDWQIEAGRPQIPNDPDSVLWSALPIQPTIQGATWTYSGIQGAGNYVRLRANPDLFPGSNENHYSNLLLISGCF